MDKSLTAVLVVASLAWAEPAFAQTDYRNLDDGRPSPIEDAYPVERYAFELLLPYEFVSEGRAGSVHSVVPELEYGIVRNTQVAVRVPVAATDGPGDDRAGVAGAGFGALYNFNTEGPVLPGLSLRADVGLPVGSLGGSRTALTLKAIATRSWGRTRLHLNGGVGFRSGGTSSVAEPAPRWSAGLAVDHTRFRASTLLVAAIQARQPEPDSPTELDATAGVRWQWRPTGVLDFGLTRRLLRHGPNLGVTLGYTTTFAIAGLMPGGR